jgi:hypothetical protein
LVMVMVAARGLGRTGTDGKLYWFFCPWYVTRNKMGAVQFQLGFFPPARSVLPPEEE